MSWGRKTTLAGLFLLTGFGAAATKELTLSYQFTGSEQSGSSRLFRNGTPSNYLTAKPFPGTSGGTNYFYTYSFVPRVGTQITAKQITASTDFFLSLYSGSFSPASLATNYLGDAGNSAAGITFSVIAPGGNVLLVLNTVRGLDTSTLFNFGILYTPVGPDLANTLTALWSNAYNLRGLLDRRLSGLALMSDYDCNAFDKHGVCVSFQARYSNFDSFNEGAGVLTAAYRVTPQVRLGAFVDYRGAEKEPSGINFSNDLPTFGAFLRYNQNLNGIGLQAKVLAAFQNGDATITRGSSLADTEPGSGKASLNSYVISGELGWGFAFSPTMLATPYVGVRYTEAARGAYTEATTPDVEYPISYDQHYQRLTTATAGLRVSGMFTEKVGYQIGAAIEHDLQREFSAYSGTSTISGLESFSLDTNGANNRTRGVGTLGLFYQAQNNMRLTGNISVRNQAFSSQTAISAIAGFQVAF